MILPGMPRPVSANADGPPAIGEAWEGGYYFGDITDGGILYHLVVSPVASGYSPSPPWKSTNSNTSGTDSMTNGPANTAAMNTTAHPAAYFCKGLSIGGYSDWYLGAADEMIVLGTNNALLPSAERLAETPYWTSTQASSTQARRLLLSTVTLGLDNKNGSNPARAIRRVAA